MYSCIRTGDQFYFDHSFGPLPTRVAIVHLNLLFFFPTTAGSQICFGPTGRRVYSSDVLAICLPPALPFAAPVNCEPEHAILPHAKVPLRCARRTRTCFSPSMDCMRRPKHVSRRFLRWPSVMMVETGLAAHVSPRSVHQVETPVCDVPAGYRKPFSEVWRFLTKQSRFRSLLRQQHRDRRQP